MANANIHYFGIRHHGPGSAKRLVAALEVLQPDIVLIEGPADCSELMPLLNHPQMKPPIALLAYVAEKPAYSLYYPFAEFSPEYQASRWALKANVLLQYIDLPVNIQLAQMVQQAETAQKELEQAELEEKAEEELPESGEDDQTEGQWIGLDPIGSLAKLSGYEDGEAWWNDLIEQNSDDNQDIFSVVELAMTELRRQVEADDIRDRDLLREAFMRLEIAKAAKTCDGPIAVVCGAWHVPALKEKHAAKSDRELLKSLPAKLAQSKVKSTWVPWTSPRLAMASGYGAGVSAPMWYEHLWRQAELPRGVENWLTHVAIALRSSGQVISTASVIEAVRLSHSLAAVRCRPEPAFEEIREAVVACMCFGEARIWQQVEKKILLGDQVGQIPDNAPLVPLLEDLQRQQKTFKLKPEALPGELSLDLRSESGLGKSVLLHRLNILNVPWGEPVDSGKSRGTFREKWQLCWQPEFSVQLLENLVYGSTIEHAAENKIQETLSSECHLNELAKLIQACLDAQLNKAADIGLARIDDRAAHTSDCLELLESLPSLIDVNRYGTARAISIAHIDDLVIRLTKQTALALPYACRNLDDEEAEHYCRCITASHQSVQLAELEASIMDVWWQALHTIIQSSQSSLRVAGLCAHLLYQANLISPEHLQDLLGRALSPAIPTADAARFFEGFFSNAVNNLIHDRMLLEAIENWLIQLSNDEFIEFLPLFRRVFSELDAMERKRLIDTILKGRAEQTIKRTVNPITMALWPEHLQRMGQLINRESDWTQ